MRRTLRWMATGLVSLFGLLVVLLAGIAGGTATQPGRAVLERLVVAVTANEVRIDGLSGWIFGTAHVAQIQLRDANGVWLTINGATLDWSPLRLLSGTISVRRLAADQITVARRPLSSGSTTSGSTTLPLRVDVQALAVGRLVLAAPVVGKAATLALDGAAHLDAIDRGNVQLDLRRVDGAGTYGLDGTLDPAGLHAKLHLAEPPDGLVASLAGVPMVGAITADATLAGPLTAIATAVNLNGGPLQATITGQVDVTHQAADLTVSATAPAMTPRPDLSWHDVALQGQVHGPFIHPTAQATLTINALTAGTTSVGQVSAKVSGDEGSLSLDGALTNVRLPAAQPDVLAAAPIQLHATAQLNAPDRPVTFTISHTLFSLTGHATLSGTQQAELQVNVPDISPLANAGGIANVAGQLGLTLKATRHGDDTNLSATGSVGLTRAPGPTTSVLGPQTRLDAQATLRNQTITISHLTIDSGALTAGLQGKVAPGALDLQWTVAVADLAKVQPTINGLLRATGQVQGTPDDLAVTADITGEVGAPGIPPGQISTHVALANLPNAPHGTLDATGTLLGAPLTLKVTAARDAGITTIAIDQAAWKSAHAEGRVQVPLDTLAPEGHATFAMGHLDDLTPLLGRPVRGSVNGTLDGTRESVHLTVTASDAELPGTATIAKTMLDATVRDPTNSPSVDARLTVDGLTAGNQRGAAQLTVQGPLSALAMRLTATAPNVAGAAANMTASATINATQRTVAIASLQAAWKQQTLRLLAPARIDLAAGVSVDRVRLGLQQAVLEASGRISPTLDLTLRLQNLTPRLATAIDPALAADGMIAADARLTGTMVQPNGTIRLTARGLRATTGPGRSLPPTDLSTTVTLQGTAARLDTTVTAGPSHLALTGTVGLAAPTALDLRATGAVDLAMTDPLLTPNGRRARGRLTLDATITGTAAAPRVGGSANLVSAAFRDFAQGIDLGDIGASLTADGGTLRLTQLTAKAGPGTINGSGSVDLTAPGMPIDLTVTARHARPLANDLLTASLDADLNVRGNLAGPLTVGGNVLVQRVDIRIPERLPATVATLNVRMAGTPPPPPAPPPAQIALNLTVDAPQQIFVRGRGVDAELGGKIVLKGTTAQPVPSGGFTLRHGQFSLAGQVLGFTSGQVSFNGGSLTNPSLNFVASTSTSDVTANLTITGTAEAPKITLSSTPSLPQDEVLSYLLYGTRTAALGPLEIAQIAATLASLSGAAPGLSNPLENMRQALGLDRLSVGAGSQLEAGRYVARNVYVGARQSVTGTGTQAVVQVDLAKGLKLEATAGSSAAPSATGAGGSADAATVGIRYQFEY